MRRTETYKVLSEVYFKDRHAHLVLKELDLKPEDQAFVSALVYTTLQHSLYLDYQFEDFEVVDYRHYPPIKAPIAV